MAEQGPGPVTDPGSRPGEVFSFTGRDRETTLQPPAPGSTIMTRMRAEFIDFYDKQHHALVAFLMNSGASFHTAEDAMQETFAAAWKLVRSGEWSKVTNPPGWIRGVGLRKYYGQIAPGVTPLDFANAPDPGERPTDVTDETLIVMEALHSLPSDQRVAIAFMMDGFTCPETASHLGITDQQVRDLRKRARKFLAGKLDETQARRRAQ
jgi:DNA-directed RNA polymerase specialized sigma24 family protein